MCRCAEQSFGVAGFDDPAEVHHCCAISDMMNDVEVVGDDDHRESESLAQAVQQVQDLALHGDV